MHVKGAVSWFFSALNKSLIHRIVRAQRVAYFSMPHMLHLVGIDGHRWNSVFNLFISLIGCLSISHAFSFLGHLSCYSFGASLTSRNNLSSHPTIAILSCFTAMRIRIRQADAAISLCCFRSSFSSLSFLGRHMCQKRGTELLSPTKRRREKKTAFFGQVF